MSKYNVFIETNDSFIPAKVENTYNVLPTGCYSPTYDADRDQVAFHKLDINTDDIIDLPSKEYEFVTSQMNNFLKSSTKDKFIKEGFLYKRSVLLHGKPGTGKTVIVSRVTREALKNEAIVLFNPWPAHLPHIYKALDATAPDKLTLVIFEEFDDLVSPGSGSEKHLLSILDGEVQKNNIIYMATTNYIDRVPLRVQRPGRFSNIVEVGFPSAEARAVYLNTKNVDKSMLSNWVETTDGFSIDELKETVLAVKCLDEKLEDVVSRLRDLKARGLEADVKDNDDEEDDDIRFNSFGSSIKPLYVNSRSNRRR